MTEAQTPALEACPGCARSHVRLIGGPGTAGGPKYWVGCDFCKWRTWGDDSTQAIAAWNTRAKPALEPVAWMNAKEIAAAALLDACEGDPADPEHPDTICVTTDDFEIIVRCAVENWMEAHPPADRALLDEAVSLLKAWDKYAEACADDSPEIDNTRVFLAKLEALK